MSERMDDNEKLRGLLWFAWYEFNAINARSGAPLDQYGMTLVDHEYWQWMRDQFAQAIGEEGTTPWPTPEAKKILENRKLGVDGGLGSGESQDDANACS